MSVLVAGIGWSIRTVEEPLVVALKLVVQHDPVDVAALGFNARGLGLIQPIELGVVGDLPRLHEPGVKLLGPAVPRAADACRAGACPRA